MLVNVGRLSIWLLVNVSNISQQMYAIYVFVISDMIANISHISDQWYVS